MQWKLLHKKKNSLTHTQHEIGFAVFFFLTRNKFVQCNGYGYNNDDDNNKFDRDER